ncbi:YncE family protein [Mycobacterium sp. NPDC048908]|uniref:YncE family protein n=1 Tax=Mycobacterium sp. NPDC048908 TaxID=3364292 RepID=UPI00371ECBFA
MKMANFLLPKGTGETHVNTEATADPEVALVGAVAVGRGPIGDIAAGDVLIATNYGDNSVSFVNPGSLQVEDTIGVPGEPFAVVVSNDRAYVSTSSESHDIVSMIDANTRTVIATYPLAFGITALAISPDGKRVYAGRTGQDHVDIAVIDTTAERVGTIDVATGAGIGIDAVMVDPGGKRLYIATTDIRGSQLVVIDAETTRVDRKVWVGAPIRDIAFADGSVYVLTSDRNRGGAVSVIDVATSRVTDTIELGIGAPTQMVLGPDKTRAYIVDYDRVVVVCMLSHDVVTDVTVGARPSCVAVDSEGGRIAIADYAGNVNVFAVASTLPQLYSQLVATEPIASAGARELAPAAV